MAKSGDTARRLATVVIVAAMLWPLIPNEDGLPLSTYPMYSGTRSETLAFITASGVDSNGTSVRLTMPEIAQTRDPLIAQSFLNDAVGVGSVDRVCREIASRLDMSRVTRVEIAREVHHVTAFVKKQESLVERVELAGCDVGS